MAAKSRTRWILIAAVAVVAVGGVAVMFLPRPVAVDVATAGRSEIAETVQDQGQARVREAYVVAAPVAGRLERTPLKVGDTVRAGATVVARLRPAAAGLLDPSVRAQREAAVGAAKADLARLQAERVRTAAELARVRPLAEAGYASRQSLDDAQAAAVAAQNAEAAARSQVAAAQAALLGPQATGQGLVVLTAPASGYVTRVIEPSERTVQMGAPLIEISDGHSLEAAIEFLSQDAVRIREGMAAEIYDWGGPGVIAAKVRRIEPQGFTKTSALGVEEQRAIVLLQFEAPPAAWSRLAPGYRVWGRVFLRREPAALTVPLGALARQAGGWAVWRIEAGRARLRPVRVGTMNDRQAEILGGLAAGDRVVVFPPDTVHDGVAVKAR
ncbi:MAG: efflux RND transporter periplasmic adaptor subunit [Proteobacteria bacterium]|nr:efflux RND transporter periplasmic adaptor subunit [Pseudomonadota bacterium]